MLADKSGNDLLLYETLVNIVNKAITKDSVALVSPQADELALCLELVDS